MGVISMPALELWAGRVAAWTWSQTHHGLEQPRYLPWRTEALGSPLHLGKALISECCTGCLWSSSASPSSALLAAFGAGLPVSTPLPGAQSSPPWSEVIMSGHQVM